MWRLLTITALLLFSVSSFAQASSTFLASLPLVRDDGADSFPFWRVLLVILIGAGVTMIFAHRKIGMNASHPLLRWIKQLSSIQPKSIRVVSSVRLSSTAVVHDVQWQGRRYLLASTDATVVALSEVVEFDGDGCEDGGL